MLLAHGFVRRAAAQNDGPVLQTVHPEYFNVYNCFPDGAGRPGASVRNNRPTATRYSYNGVCHTPKDVLRVLVIYAGFTNDNIPDSDPNWTQVPNNNNNPENDWPQVRNGSAWGESLPRSAGSVFYSDINKFSSSATDRSVSNFYYQMSQHSARPFKLLAVNFPIRVNVTATTSINSNTYGAWATYNAMVVNKIQTMYQAQLNSLPIVDLDQRKNHPDYEADNTSSAPDGQIDYTIIVWRYAGGSPYQTQNLNRAEGSGGGFANISSGYVIPASGTVPGLRLTDGYTQCQGYSGLSKPLFTHEFGHTLYYAPHYNGANGVVGSHYYIAPGHGMIGGPMLSSANAWERWFLDWIPLEANGVSGDIDEGTLPTGTGSFVLRDFVTTGDALRIRLPFTYNPATNTHQYLWLENHTGKSVWDRAEWVQDGQTPAQPFPGPTRGIVAFVEDMRQIRESPLDGISNNEAYKQGANGLKFLSREGYREKQVQPTTGQTYNNHLWGNLIYKTFSYDYNSMGSYNALAMLRADRNNDGVIGYDTFWNGASNEGYYYFADDSQPTDGFIGPYSGFSQVGQKMGNDEDSAITPHQTFDANAQQLSPIEISGLSVELTGSASDGSIEVTVRYQDTDIRKRMRWAGNLAVNDIYGASNGYDVNVKSGVVLYVNAGQVPNRTQPLTPGNFVNPTYLRVRDNATFHVENDGIVRLGGGSTWYVDDNGSLLVEPSGRLYIENNALVSLPYQSTYNALTSSNQLVLLTGGRVEIRQTGQVVVGRSSSSTLSVYPNPTTESAHFTLTNTGKSTYSFRLLTPYGTSVRTGKVEAAAARQGVTIPGLAPGTYLLEVMAEDGTRYTQRLHIQP